MNITEEKVSDLNKLLTVKLSPEDYLEKYESTLKEYRKRVNLPGFREGKVPMSLIKKKYGQAIMAEEVNRVLNEKLYDYIQENKLDILGNPLPKMEDHKGYTFNAPEEFEFTYEIGLAPDFDVALDKLKCDFYKIKVDDELINKQIDDLTRRYGKLVNIDKSKDTDMLLGKFEQLDDKGNVVEGGISHTSTISVEFVEDKGMKKKLTGLTGGDTVKLDPKKVSKGDADMAAMLGITEDVAKELATEFNFTVNEVKRMEPAELNQAFFDKMFGEGSVKDEKDFRGRVKADLERMFSQDSDRIFQRDIGNVLMDKLKLELPDDFLKRWIQASNEKPLTIEQIEEEYDDYAKSLKWQLIENKIIKDNEMKVEAEEAMDYAKNLMANQYAQYGLMTPDDETLTESATKILTNKDESRRIYEALYNVKVLSHLKDTVKIKEKEVSYDELVEIAKK